MEVKRFDMFIVPYGSFSLGMNSERSSMRRWMSSKSFRMERSSSALKLSANCLHKII